MEEISFEAEVRSAKSKKLITNDIEYSVTLTGSSPSILQLGHIPGDTTIQVTVKINK